MGALCLTRTTNPESNRIFFHIETASGESIVIIQDVYEVHRGLARIAIHAPDCVKVMRGEIVGRPSAA